MGGHTVRKRRPVKGNAGWEGLLTYSALGFRVVVPGKLRSSSA